MFRGSSAAEQSTVNRSVVGSIPTRGAISSRILWDEASSLHLIDLSVQRVGSCHCSIPHIVIKLSHNM